jgi:hypothetical protein
MIKIKSIIYERLDSYIEEDVKKWFDEYHKVLKRFKIKYAKNIVNFDETGTWIGYTGSEDIIVLIEVMELYKVSPENRKSIMICEVIRVNGSESPPPYIIVPGEKIMEAWVIQELIGKERIRPTITGYTNNKVILEYLDHLILYLRVGLEKPWKILLMDSHELYKIDGF